MMPKGVEHSSNVKILLPKEPPPRSHGELWITRTAFARRWGVSEKYIRNNAGDVKRVRRIVTDAGKGKYTKQRYSVEDMEAIECERERAAYTIDGTAGAAEVAEVRDERARYNATYNQRLASGETGRGTMTALRSAKL